MSLKSTWRKPPGSGSKPSWYLGCAVAVTVARVRPWKLPALRPAALRRGPLAHQLDRGLVGLGAGVAQEGALGEARGRHQLLRQPQRRLAVEDVAGVPEFAGLFHQRGGQLRGAVAQAAHRDAGGEVDVVAALAVPDGGTGAALEDHPALAVDRQQHLAAQRQQFVGRCGLRHLTRRPCSASKPTAPATAGCRPAAAPPIPGPANARRPCGRRAAGG